MRGRQVIVVEDGPTLTHGSMTYGAGVVGARAAGAAHIVDPVPYAVGSIAAWYAALLDDNRGQLRAGGNLKLVDECLKGLDEDSRDVVLRRLLAEGVLAHAD